MARVPVIEIHCDRCKRVEHRSGTGGSSSTLETTGFTAVMGSSAESGKIDLSFDDLCAPCERTIRGYLELISKKPEKLSPDRKKGRGKKGASEEEGSAPTSPLVSDEAPRVGGASASTARRAPRAS